MTRRCSYLLADGRKCRHRIEDPRKPDCGRHAVLPASHSDAQRQLALSITTADDVLAALVESGDPVIRLAVAQNPQTPAYSLQSLAEDPSVDVRMAVAEHSNTDGFTLNKMALDPEAAVRLAVAGNPNTPSDARQIIQQNPNLPQSIRTYVEPEYARCGQLYGNRCKRMVNGPDWSHDKHPTSQGLAHAARSTELPESLWQVLVRTWDWDNKRPALLVSGNPHAPAHILESFWATHLPPRPRYDDEWRDAALLGRNPATPEWVLEEMIEREAVTKEFVAANVAASPDLLRSVYDHGKQILNHHEFIGGHASDDITERVHQALASNPSCPLDILLALCSSSDAQVYRAANDHPTVVWHLQALAEQNRAFNR